jgi:hypothetical protein
MDQATLHRLRAQDRVELGTLLTALNGAKRSMRLDECGDWMLDGKHGQVRACNGAFSIYIDVGSQLAWTWAKRKLAGIATMMLDADQDGVLTMTRMPNVGEALIVRGYVGLRQTRDMPPDRAQAFRKDA